MIAASDIGLGDIVIYVIAGAIIGALARLIVPGKQSMSIAITIGLGIVAAVIGGFLWNAVFPDNEGIAWIGSLIVAVVLVFLYATLFGSRTRT
ncbi:MAG: GlsB/YeaQ/YmgE family stress response membrane protein [Nocardioidaceae bacterium]